MKLDGWVSRGRSLRRYGPDGAWRAEVFEWGCWQWRVRTLGPAGQEYGTSVESQEEAVKRADRKCKELGYEL